jgi:WD40 repeat protein/predicted Ser/Thr protein kinase
MKVDETRSEDPSTTDGARAQALLEGGQDTELDASAEFAAELGSALGDDSERGLETRRQKALIAAALFDEPVTPVKIGRFTIVRELGAGGMGVVYVAYDEQLDRRVAVKLLRGAAPSPDASHRLAREAQAMARLSHPNVVTVHEVGTFEGQVFVAMEFVDGQDLRGWLKATQRSWREVVDAFRQAGEGLAAAHDAGIVHRDFKPDNVLVGKDGRVRVADFGLAHAFDDPVEPREADITASHSSGRLHVSLTRTGAIMGTPAYMPPEQFSGTRTDARSDQFSFCVALWEGLYGRRPFVGHNIAALSLAIIEGRVETPPAETDVPSWIAAILMRGLSPMPDDRWPSMRELLDAIGRDPIARRRKALLSFGLGGGAIALVGILSWVTATELRHNARQRYWNALTERLLEIERDRGLEQANDDALRARDATRMSVYRRYRPSGGGVDHEDPTVAAALLREVEGKTRASSEWVSAANETLGRPISYAVLEGHRDGLSALTFSPDGQWLYSASFDGEVRRWNISNGTGESIILHGKQVTKLAVSSDGRLLASSSHDGTVRLWSPDDPGRSRILVERGRAVMDVAFDPSGRYLASAWKDGTVELHDLESGELAALAGHEEAVYGVSFDEQGARVLTTSGDHTAKLWRVRDQALLATLSGHEAEVYHGRILSEDRVVTAADDGTVRLHDLTTGHSRILAQHARAITSLDIHADKVVSAALDGTMLVSSLEGSAAPLPLPAHDDMTWAVAFTPDGQQVASGSFDTTARLTRADGRGVARVFVGHRLSLSRAVIDHSGRWLATCSYDTTIRLWDLEQVLLEIPLIGHSGKVLSVELDHGGDKIATGSHDGGVRIWDSRDGTAIATLAAGTHDVVNHAVFDPTGEIVGVARMGKVAELWQLDTRERRALLGHTEGVWRVGFDPAGRRIASASFDGSARIWSVADAVELAVLQGHTDKVTGVDFSPDGERITTASYDGTVRVWDPDTAAQLAILRGHTGKISALVRSPDGHTLATASDDGTARLWPDNDSINAIVLAGHEKPVWSISFDETGERVATGSFDGQARVWRTSDGTLLHSLVGHADAVWDADFGPGERVITVSNDNTVRVWSLASDDPPIVLSGHDAGITSLAVTPDGERIVSASSDGTAKLWRLDRLTGDPDQLLDRLARATLYCLSLDERRRELGEAEAQAQAGRLACERNFGG